jgi:signal transduction histidine kinase
LTRLAFGWFPNAQQRVAVETPRTPFEDRPMSVSRTRDAQHSARVFRRAICGLVVAAIMLFATDCARAADDLSLASMNHKTWTARDGAPQGVRSLALDPDGTLWIGTEIGLFNFDGRTFRPFRPLAGESDLPVGNISALVIAHDGALWAATIGGVVRIADGHTTHHASIGDQRLGSLLGLAVASDGSVWAYGRTTLARFGADGVDQLEATPVPIDSNAIGGMFVDSADTLWVSQGNRLYRRPANEAAYVATDTHADFIFGESETPDHSVWVTDYDTAGGFARHQRIDRTGKVVAHLPPNEAAYDILYAPDGSLILATQFAGLRRYRAGAAATQGQVPATEESERFTTSEGLSSNSVRAMLLDGDGNLWIGNQHGLDRFRAAQLIPFPGKQMDSQLKICATAAGDLWIASTDGDLYEVSRGVAQRFPGDAGDIYHVACGIDSAWLVDKEGIRMMRDGKAVSIPAPPGSAPYAISKLLGTENHELYASVGLPLSAAGIWLWHDNQWIRQTGTGSPGVLATAPQALYIDSKKRLWSGYRDGEIALPFDGDGKVFLSGSPGLGFVLGILETKRGVFAAGANGVAVFRGDRFEMLRFADAATVRGVGGLVEAANEDLWLNAAQGVVRVPAAELDRALADSRHTIQSTLVSEGEFVGPVPLVVKDTVARDADGNLWFATLNGVFHLNPARLDAASRHPPIVSLRSMTVDGRRIATSAHIGPDPQTLVIQYLGVNLTSPERVIYKYRLDGLEDAWQEAGHRTEAIYTRLAPGTYTFNVMAANGDGQWSVPLALPSFTVVPGFFQTTWFLLLCALAALLIIFAVSALRIRAITRLVRTRVEERADERVRIARDLHDTLLQGVQGLLLNVHVATRKIPADAESKPMLERALLTADRIIIEGRNRLSTLRSEHVTDAELTEAIESVCRDLAPGNEAHYLVIRRGSTKLSLHPHVADEIFHIAREALTNAFRYADATGIEIVLDYGRRTFELVCEDNGRGFAAAARDKAGHWGLKGMAERAERLGAEFECRSAVDRGTRISVTLAAFRAYDASRWMHWLRALFAKPAIAEQERRFGRSR